MLFKIIGFIKLTYSKNEKQSYTNRTINYFIPCINRLPVTFGSNDIRQKILVELYEPRC